MTVDSARLDRKRFDELFSRIASSETLAAIWREVYQDDYPEGSSPFSFVTKQELHTMASALRRAGVRRFLDIGCGQGGPSTFVARAAGAAAVGVDSSLVAVAVATRGVSERGNSVMATFLVGDAATIALRDDSVDAAISVDALQLMPARADVLREVARVVRRGGVFAFTTWVLRRTGPGPPFPTDYDPLLREAGLSMESCNEPPGWEARESAVFAGIRNYEQQLCRELGDSVATMLAAEASKMPANHPLIKRVNILARTL